VADTLAVLPISPAIVVVTTTVIVAFAPFAKLPRLHVKTPPEGTPQVPWLGLAESNVTLAGNVSVTVTPVAELGPLLVTVIVYVTCSPTETGSGVSVLVIARSAEETEGLTVVDEVALLLPGTGSLVVLDTLAVLLNVPAAVGVTTIVTVALAPLATLPRLQVTVLVPLQPPWLGVADTNVVAAGNVSVTVTAEAEVGPPLVTVME
jgi:hypothetical protein